MKLFETEQERWDREWKLSTRKATFAAVLLLAIGLVGAALLWLVPSGSLR